MTQNQAGDRPGGGALPTAEELERMRHLATTALRKGMAARWDQAVAATQQLEDEFPGTGTFTAMIHWCDTLISTVDPGHVKGTPIAIKLTNGSQAADGSISGIRDSMPTREAIWAGKLIAARAENDADAYMALMTGLPNDARVIGGHVLTLLQVVAMTITWARSSPAEQAAAKHAYN